MHGYESGVSITSNIAFCRHPDHTSKGEVVMHTEPAWMPFTEFIAKLERGGWRLVDGKWRCPYHEDSPLHVGEMVEITRDVPIVGAAISVQWTNHLLNDPFARNWRPPQREDGTYYAPAGARGEVYGFDLDASKPPIAQVLFREDSALRLYGVLPIPADAVRRVQ